MSFAGLASAKTFIDSGKLKAIGLTGEKRVSVAPNIPTLPEQRLKGDVFRITGWVGIAAPAATPKAVQMKIAEEIRAVLQMPDVKAKINTFGTEASGLGPDEFTAAYKRDLPACEKAVGESGATLD